MADSTNPGKEKTKEVVLPGGKSGPVINYSPQQDSAYLEALKLKLPTLARLENDIKLSEGLWKVERELASGKPWQIAMKNINNIPRQYFIPSGNERVQHEINRQMSQYIPGINTLSPYGAKISFADIGSMLGLTEDVSPVITYKLDYYVEIEVVIYSIRAVVIATLFEGKQPPGPYKITWNGRDDKGRKMPRGDYIGEVRIGKERLIRKRIVIN